MDLKLERPLVVFDIESTGVNPMRDRIVELAVLKISPDGAMQSTVRRVNPEVPIPPGAAAVHGITDADVADKPPFSVIAANFARYLDDCDLGGYNLLNFDVPLLQAEFQRAAVPFSLEGRRIIDVYNIFCKLYPRTLTAAYQFFCGRDLNDAHAAAADTQATWEVLLGQLARHQRNDRPGRGRPHPPLQVAGR